MPNAYGLLHCNNCSCFSKCHQKIWTPLSNLLLRELICSVCFVLILICIFLNQQQMFLSLQGQHALKLLRTSRIYQNSVHFSWECVKIIYFITLICVWECMLMIWYLEDCPDFVRIFHHLISIWECVLIIQCWEDWIYLTFASMNLY